MPVSPGFKVMWLLISDVITIFSEVMAWGWNVLKIMPLHIFYFSPSLIPYSSSHHAEKWFTVRLKHWQWYCDFEIFEWFTGLFFFPLMYFPFSPHYTYFICLFSYCKQGTSSEQRAREDTKQIFRSKMKTGELAIKNHILANEPLDKWTFSKLSWSHWNCQQQTRV